MTTAEKMIAKYTKICATNAAMKNAAWDVKNAGRFGTAPVAHAARTR